MYIYKDGNKFGGEYAHEFDNIDDARQAINEIVEYDRQCTLWWHINKGFPNLFNEESERARYTIA